MTSVFVWLQNVTTNRTLYSELNIVNATYVDWALADSRAGAT